MTAQEYVDRRVERAVAEGTLTAESVAQLIGCGVPQGEIDFHQEELRKLALITVLADMYLAGDVPEGAFPYWAVTYGREVKGWKPKLPDVRNRLTWLEARREAAGR